MSIEAITQFDLDMDGSMEPSEGGQWVRYEDHLQAIAEAEKQEPVAWMDGPHLVMRSDWSARANYKGPWIDFGRAVPDAWKPVLYTSPQQRQPLTDEPTKEMIEAGAKAAREYMEETGGNSPAVIWKAMYAAAHGIKGEA